VGKRCKRDREQKDEEEIGVRRERSIKIGMEREKRKKEDDMR